MRRLAEEIVIVYYWHKLFNTAPEWKGKGRERLKWLHCERHVLLDGICRVQLKSWIMVNEQLV